MGSSSISMNISMGSESTQAAMERLMQQMNSQGLFNIMESIDDNLNRVNSTFGISYRVLKLVGSSMSSKQLQ